MNKGTAIVGFFMSFLAGMFLMWGIDHSGNGMDIAAESATNAGEVDHSEAEIPVGPDDPVWGSPTAPVTIVEISDFECPYCGKVNPTLKALKEKYGPEKIRIVWKHNPLPFHKNARPAHEAAAAIFDLAGSDAFWKFHDLVFANRRDLNKESFKKWAKEVGVDPAKFEAALEDKKYAAKVDKDLAMSRKIGARGTPNFRINGVELSGAQPEAKFAEVIDAQLAEANKLLASGTKPAEVYPTLVAKNAKAAPTPEKAEAPPEDTTIWAVPVFDDDPKKGGKEPLVTIVEFSEFQCPFCKRVGPTMKQIIDTYGEDVQIVWKDNPLGFHPRANPAANAARAVYKAKGDKAFWAAHDALFESQPKLSDAEILDALKDLGVAPAVLQQAMTSGKYNDKFEQSSDLAMDFQARGTPHFFVNGYRVKGAQPFDEFKKVIDEQLKKAKQMVQKGTPRSQVYAQIMKEGKTPPPPPKKELGPPPANAPFKGNANAKIVIQEFSDFQCPFCSRVNPTIKEVMDKHGNEVKIVWRNMPLPFHKEAPLAAEAALEIKKQKGNDAFWAYHDKLFDGQKSPGLGREALEKYAEELGGVNMAAFKKALDDRTHKAQVDADMADGQKAGISGTPAFVVNGYFISGAQQYGAFKKAIQLAQKDL